MHTITFYSFKGGVGRTMALVNVAAELVKRGRRVLVVDFDLEAPGLETYRQLNPKKPHPGIVEYVSKFIHSRQIPNVRDYIFDAAPIGEKNGKLWIMPAGRRDRTYRQMLLKLDWKRFYLDMDGFRFFEETKKSWEEIGLDYVLIDSRTGDTDVLGICTRQLPDSVVILFVPNEQNRAGLEHVCRDIRRDIEGLPKKKLHFVAANVPNLDDEDEILRGQIRAFRKSLEFRRLAAVIRRYESLELLDQSVAVLDHRNSRLAKAYRKLTNALVEENYEKDRDGALRFLNEYAQRQFFTGNDHADLDTRKRDPLNRIANNFLDDLEIFRKIAECRIRRGDFQSALNYLERILKKDPAQPELLLLRGDCKRNLNQPASAADDFLACIRQQSFNLGQAFRALCDIAPERLAEVVDILRSQRDQLNYWDILDWAIAYWRRTGSLPREVCDIALQLEAPFGGTPEAAIWLLWGAGKKNEAMHWLDEAENSMRNAVPGSLPPDALLWGEVSPWSLEEVSDLKHYSTEDYLGDCQMVRRFFAGEPLRPAFLGPAAP